MAIFNCYVSSPKGKWRLSSIVDGCEFSPGETLRIALRNTFGLQHGSSPSTAGFTTIHEIFSIARGEHSGASNFWMTQELAFMFSLFLHILRVSQERPGLSTPFTMGESFSVVEDPHFLQVLC